MYRIPKEMPRSRCKDEVEQDIDELNVNVVHKAITFQKRCKIIHRTLKTYPPC